MVKSGWIGSSILVQSFLHYLKTKSAVIYKLAHWFFEQIDRLVSMSMQV